MFSARTDWSLGINNLTRLYHERKQLGLRIFDLTESNPTRCGFSYDEKRIFEALRNPRALQYDPDPRGLLSARLAVAEYYSERGVNLDPSQIFLTASTSEAYSFLFRLLADAGENLLVPCPSYPLFDFLIRLDNLEPRDYPLAYDRRWCIDRDALAARKNSRSRAVLVVNPNNPTGSFIRSDELDFLVECCAKAPMALIVDEVFADYEVPEERLDHSLSLAGENRVLVFALNGLSKISALPQMKCAWIAASGPQSLLQAALARLEVIADTYLPVSAPVAWALPQLLGLRREVQPQIMSRIRSNLRRLDEQVAAAPPIMRLNLEGGWYAILRLPAVWKDEEWTLRLLQKDGVLIHPGHFYEFSGENYVVLSLLPAPEIFDEGVEKMIARVKQDT